MELEVPTSESDVVQLRALRVLAAERALERINDLSATRHFPAVAQRRTTSAGFEPFDLVGE